MTNYAEVNGTTLIQYPFGLSQFEITFTRRQSLA